MAHYHFTLDGQDINDPAGADCASLPEAMQHAAELALRIGRGKPRDELRGRFICILNADGHEVYRTPLATTG